MPSEKMYGNHSYFREERETKNYNKHQKRHNKRGYTPFCAWRQDNSEQHGKNYFRKEHGFMLIPKGETAKQQICGGECGDEN